MNDPEFQPKPKSHRDDISDDEATIMAAQEILENALPTPFGLTIEEFRKHHQIKPQKEDFQEVSTEDFSELLLKLNGLELFEREVVVNDHLIDLAVSSISDMKIGYITGEYIYPGVNLTFPFKSMPPQDIEIYAEGTQGDRVRPDPVDFGPGNLIIEFSPLDPEQDYKLRVFRKNP
jgi:hypothetical protein